MSHFRSALLLCLTALIGMGMWIFFSGTQGRYDIVPQGKGVFVFDRKNAKLNFCDPKKCKPIQAHLVENNTGFVLPGKISFQEVPASCPMPVASNMMQNPSRSKTKKASTSMSSVMEPQQQERIPQEPFQEATDQTSDAQENEEEAEE